jgi:hypothetical protein
MLNFNSESLCVGVKLGCHNEGVLHIKLFNRGLREGICDSTRQG